MPPRLVNRAVKIEWHGERVMGKLRAQLTRGLKSTARKLQTHTRRLVSRTQPIIITANGRARGMNPSKEGEPPKIVTRQLRRGIRTRVESSKKVIRVVLGVIGPASAYALRLERGYVGADSLGRVFVQGPRPYLSRAAKETKGMFDALGGGGDV